MDKYLMTEKEAKQKLKENNNKLVDSSLESFVSLQNRKLRELRWGTPC